MTASDAQPVSFGTAPVSRVLAPVQGFVCLPRAVLRAPGLSVLARLLYAVLLDYARQDGHCYPGTERLRADLGCGHNQLARAVRELEAGGLVARRRRGFGKTTVYHLPTLPTATPAVRGHRAMALPARSVEALLGGPPAPRIGRPVRPDPAPQSAPVRVRQDQDSEDRDAEDQQQPPRSAPAGCTPTTPEEGDVVALLVQQGVTRGVAEALAHRYPPALVRRQVDCHRHRVTASGLTRNPVGALVKAIREDWAPPAAWAVAQSSAAIRATQTADERRRQEEEAARCREWEAKPPEERIAGRLQFWVLGRRAKRHEPTAAEIAARRAELLAELAGASAPPPPPASPVPERAEASR